MPWEWLLSVRRRPSPLNPRAVSTPDPPSIDSRLMPPLSKRGLDPSLQTGAYWVDAVAVAALLIVSLYFLIFW